MAPALPHAAPPCLQRSQLDNIVMGTQMADEEEEQGVGDNVATLEVGSAPAADDRYGGAAAPSQPEVSRPPRGAAPTQASTLTGQEFAGSQFCWQACCCVMHCNHTSAVGACPAWLTAPCPAFPDPSDHGCHGAPAGGPVQEQGQPAGRPARTGRPHVGAGRAEAVATVPA